MTGLHVNENPAEVVEKPLIMRSPGGNQEARKKPNEPWRSPKLNATRGQGVGPFPGLLGFLASS
jgi:hypothetical protein